MVLRSLFCLLLVCFVVCDPVQLYKRCDYCNTGECASIDVEPDTCTKYTNPCGPVQFGSILLQTGTEDQQSPYYLYTYGNDNCTAKIDVGIGIDCEPCHVNYECYAFFIQCNGYLWLWITIPLVLCVILLVGVSGFYFYKKQQRKSQLAQGIVTDQHPQYATYQQ